MKNEFRYSIRTQMIAVVSVIMTITMILCVMINRFFVKDLYYWNKQQAMSGYYRSVTGFISDGDREALGEELSAMRYADNISFYVYYTEQIFPYLSYRDDAGNYVSAAEKSEMEARLKEIFFNASSGNLEETVLESNDSYTIQQVSYKGASNSYMELYGMLRDHVYFLMRTPLAPVGESADAASRLLFITMLGTTLFAGILISLFTQRLTGPILKLAELSRHMARLDFTSRYEGKQNNELKVLGNSMNQMSDQLQATIDELRQANEQLRKDIEEKIQIDELRKEFLSNVSHELKTPIALIQGYAEGLQEAVNDDPESRNFYCDVIIDEAAKMNEMVRKLLTLNHLEFGQDALSPEVFSLSELLDTVLSSNELIAQGRGIRLERDYPAGCMAFADEFKIEEVITNYVSNAINHAEGEKRIRVTVAEEEERYRVTVYNTGKQIPEDSLDKVWIKFYKVDKARTREYGGSGIGLSIVKAVMDAHRQPFGVYNTAEGAAFWFCVKKAGEQTDDSDY